MSESNAVNPIRVNPDSDPADVFEVSIATRPVPIWFEYGALRDLHADVPVAEDSLGLLLGSLSPKALYIRRCDVFPVKLPKSSPTALHNPLREFINARRQSPLPGAERLVGFFRTQAGGWPEMTDSDREIAKRYFRAPGSLFLLIQTPTHRPWSAALFELDGEGASSKAPTVEFPFDEYLLRNGYLNALMEEQEPVKALAAPPAAAQPNKTGWIIAAAALAIVLGGTAAAFEYGWFRPTGRAEVAQRNASGPALLKLKVNRNGRDFEVSWDRTSDVVQQAPGGTLTISDGALTRVVALSGAQLREGQILYTPLFEELNFRLEVGTRDLTAAAESVQVLAWSGKQSADVVTVAQSDPSTNGPARIISSTGASGTGAAGKQLAPLPDPRLQRPLPASPKPDSQTKASGVVVPAASAKSVAAPAANGGKQAEPAKAAPQETARVNPPASDTGKNALPPAVVSTERPPAPQPAVQPAAPPTAQPISQPTSQPTAQPVTQPASQPVKQTTPQSTPPPQPQAPAPKPEATPQVSQTSPAVSAPSTPPPSAAPTAASSGVVLPVATQRIAPVVPRGVLSGTRVNSPRQVSVRVMVDSAGGVQSAEVVSVAPKGAFGENQIRNSALDAAKQWKFKPGQVNGRNVASEYTIDFQFR